MIGRIWTYFERSKQEVATALPLAFSDLVETFTMEPIEGWQLWQNLDGDRPFRVFVSLDEGQGAAEIRLALPEDRPEAEIEDLLERLKTRIDWRLERAT